MAVREADDPKLLHDLAGHGLAVHPVVPKFVSAAGGHLAHRVDRPQRPDPRLNVRPRGCPLGSAPHNRYLDPQKLRVFSISEV